MDDDRKVRATNPAWTAWRFPSKSGRVRLPEVEDLLGHIKVVLPEQPGESMLNLEFFTMVENACQERGYLRVVENGWYDHFIGMDDKEMRAVAACTFLGFRRHINGICFEEPEFEGLSLFGLIDTLLYLVARGNVAFTDDGDAIMRKPVGPRPTPEQQKRILERIRSDRKLHVEILYELLEGSNSDE